MKKMLLALSATLLFASPAEPQVQRPFGTLREQAETQQAWLAKRLETVLPTLMRKYGVDMWLMPMREYNEDPVFSSIVSPTTFAARRRTIYVFYDRGPDKGVEHLALGGSNQGGLYQAFRSQKAISGSAGVAGRTAELWGAQQWQLLKELIETRKPGKIAVNTSETWAFADGLSSGERQGMLAALGPEWSSRVVPAEGLAVDFIASRLPEEEVFYKDLQRLVWKLIDEMYSTQTIKPGVTRTSDLVWWWRQRVNDLGLGTWFQPSIEVQRKGVTEEALGDDPVIERGDVLHCDVGITALRLNTDTQHMAYVAREGETEAPAGLARALKNSNRLQDLLFEEVHPGRTGNQVLSTVRSRLKGEGLNGTMYSHPIGMYGHGAGTLIGLWDYQEGVPGRGDLAIIPGMWFSSELQVTTPVPEWNNQPVRMAQEEDFFMGADGKPRWANQRQEKLWIVK